MHRIIIIMMVVATLITGCSQAGQGSLPRNKAAHQIITQARIDGFDPVNDGIGTREIDLNFDGVSGKVLVYRPRGGFLSGGTWLHFSKRAGGKWIFGCPDIRGKVWGVTERSDLQVIWYAIGVCPEGLSDKPLYES